MNLTDEQKRALHEFAHKEGRNWKSKLRDMWQNANYPGYSHLASVLQYLRNSNSFGPSGLFKVRLSDLTVDDMALIQQPDAIWEYKAS